MIEIRMTDLAKAPRQEILDLIAFLQILVAPRSAAAPATIAYDTLQHSGPHDAPAAFLEMPPVAIASADSPAAGADTDDDRAAAAALAAFGSKTFQPAAAWPFPTRGDAPVPNEPPVPAAGVAAPAPSTSPAPRSGVDVDAAGLPWDARIHSSNREKNKGDQMWRARRNVDPTLVTTVEAELRAMMALPNVPPVPSPTAAIPTPPVPGVPVPPAGSVTPASPSDVTTFAQLAPRVMAAVAAGTLTHARVAEVCVSLGLANFPSLVQRPDYVPQVFAALFPA